MSTLITQDGARIFDKDWGRWQPIQIVPIAASALKAAKLIGQSELKVYPDASHGLAQTDPDQFNADLLAFIRS